jgi:hypothetical protein
MSVDAAAAAIRASFASGHLPPVDDAVTQFLSARSESAALDTIWGPLATAVARGEFTWCEQFMARVPTASPSSIVLGIHLVTLPERRKLCEARVALAARLTHVPRDLADKLAALD